ncbi:MAG TPA: RluA family pseudouridine synthase [Anaerolineae bacterium]|nr:RluA family pseudouridine synthase [Anaerolineae bacterium]
MEEETIFLTVTDAGERLDKYLAQAISDLSRAQVQRLIAAGRVTVNGVSVNKASLRLEAGDEVVIRVPPPESTEVHPEAIPLSIVYEDDDLLVIDKPAGMVVHPAHGHRSGTLVNALLSRYPQLAEVGGAERAGIVHRLDKDTSGLILVAKNEAAQKELQRQFKHHAVEKVYLALVEGRLEPEQGLIDAPIGRDKQQRKRMAVVRGGRQASTVYRVIERFEDHTLVEARPQTGRTHQIRVHFAFIGHPLVGDRVYGYRRQHLGLGRQFLHAQTLSFRLPSSGEVVEFHSPLPDDLRRVLVDLRAR